VPIYEYRCSSCGYQKEFLRKVSDPALSFCPECGKETFGKMLTSAGFQLKGGGWYATDFKNSGAKPAAKTEGQSETAGKAESTADKKTVTASESKSDGKTQSRPAAAAAPAAPASTAKAE
jgi:putative FmdB family regulatory protein